MIEGVDLDAIEREQELFNFGRTVETVGNGVVNGAASTVQLALLASKLGADAQTLGMRTAYSTLTGEELKELELLKRGIIKAEKKIAECKEKGLGEYIADEGAGLFRKLNQRWTNTDDTCHEMGEVTGEMLWDIALSIGIFKACTPKKPGASTVGNAVDDSLDTLRTSVQQWDDYARKVDDLVTDTTDLSKVSKYADELMDASRGARSTEKLPKSPYEFMDNTVDHIFNGKVEMIGTTDEYAVGWHYQGRFNPSGNKITQILEEADEYGTIIAEVEIGGVPKGDVSSFFSNKYTPNEVVDMIMEAHMSKKKVSGTQNCFRGVADNGMVIEMYLAGKGDDIAEIITAYPIHTSQLP